MRKRWVLLSCFWGKNGLDCMTGSNLSDGIFGDRMTSSNVSKTFFGGFGTEKGWEIFGLGLNVIYV